MTAKNSNLTLRKFKHEYPTFNFYNRIHLKLEVSATADSMLDVQIIKVAALWPPDSIV
jgi:hypothetical protein